MYLVIAGKNECIKPLYIRVSQIENLIFKRQIISGSYVTAILFFSLLPDLPYSVRAPQPCQCLAVPTAARFGLDISQLLSAWFDSPSYNTSLPVRALILLAVTGDSRYEQIHTVVAIVCFTECVLRIPPLLKSSETLPLEFYTFSSFSWKVNVCNKKSERQKITMKLMCRLENNIELNINETGRDVFVRIQVAHSTDKWWSLIDTGRNQTSVSAKHQDIINKSLQ